jgi:hypothetical protein
MGRRDGGRGCFWRVRLGWVCGRADRFAVGGAQEGSPCFVVLFRRWIPLALIQGIGLDGYVGESCLVADGHGFRRPEQLAAF